MAALAAGASVLSILNRGQIAGSNAAFDVAQAIATLVFATVGALIASNRPDNSIGWVLIGASVGVEGAWYFLSQYAIYALATRPGSLPGGAMADPISLVAWAPHAGSRGRVHTAAVPDGHVPSPRWRWVAWTLGLSVGLLTLSHLLLPGKLDDGSLHGPQNPLGLTGWTGPLQIIGGGHRPVPAGDRAGRFGLPGAQAPPRAG